MTTLINPSTEPCLTSLSHGGGCGCKIAPAVLSEILAKSSLNALQILPRELLVGIENSDDAAVYQINEHQAIVATTDFFMPIVDDPFEFGRIAATNAISDIYAMGATPLFALALVGMPVNKLSTDTIAKILDGGQCACREANIPIAGGHTIDSLEPIYGLVAIGIVDPKNLRKNSDAKKDDVLILGKALGVGIYSAALKKGALAEADYQEMIRSTTKLNTAGIKLARLEGVSALTDVTGFGLLGHLLEVCKGAKLSATVDYAAIPFLPNVKNYAAQGFVTGASARNWRSVADFVSLDLSLDDVAQNLLTDPQTSGGLLVSCSPKSAEKVLSIFKNEGFLEAAIIGKMAEKNSDPRQITVA